MFRRASEILGIGERAQVMLLGTFHFAAPGLDRLNLHVDMMTAQRQAEIEEVVRQLESFRPTKIAVEAPLSADHRLQQSFTAYQDGTFALPANEIYQLGFRLAARLGHRRVHPIDAWAHLCESEAQYLALAERCGFEGPEAMDGLLYEPVWWQRITELFRCTEELIKTKSLKEYLLFLNSPEQIRLSHGQYLSWPDGAPGDYRAADFITAWWYNRNLRIFANLKRITESPKDRILVIYGSGHLPLLRHAVELSYLHELVEVEPYLAL